MMKKSSIGLSAAINIAACLLLAASAFAAAPGKAITNVTSQNMVYDSAAQKVTFTGEVKVTHPDFTLSSDKLQLFMGEGASAAQGSDRLNAGAVQRIIAESKVHINLPEGRTATCNKATYRVESETLTMEGNPVLREGPNQVRGDKMVFYLREGRNEVQGRVAVDFISDDAPAARDGSGLGNILGGGKP